MYTLFRIGQDTTVSSHLTETSARNQAVKEFDAMNCEYEGGAYKAWSGNSLIFTTEGVYQEWLVVEEPANDDLLAKAFIELELARAGLDEFACTLETQDTCGDHLAELFKLLKQLEAQGGDGI